MMFRSRTIFRKAVRRLIGLGVLLGICAVVFPVPVTLHLPSETDGDKDCSQPFPCMNRPCGCRSADECWKKCCCFTNVQKVAWAKANRISLPRFVMVAAAKEEHSDCQTCTESKDAKSVCGQPQSARSSKCTASATKKSSAVSCCCSEDKDDESKSVAANLIDGRTSGSACTDGAPAKHKVSCCSKKTASRTKWVLAVKAAECQGQSVFWLTLPPTIIPAWPVLPPNAPMIVDSLQTVSERLPVVSLRPPCPPPKIG